MTVSGLRRPFFLALLALLSGASVAPLSAADESIVLLADSAVADSADRAAAVAIVEQLHSGLSGTAAGSDSAEDKREQLAALLDATHDFNTIGRIVAGRWWRNASAQEQIAFQAVFRDLSAALFAQRFADGKAIPRFELTDVQAQGVSGYRVQATLLTASGQTHLFEYLVQADMRLAPPPAWRIVNIIVDGVSDLALKRAEYSTVLREKGWDALLLKMKQQRLALIADADEAR